MFARQTGADRHRAAGWMSEITLSLARPDDQTLTSGEVVADPFRRTSEAVELLRCLGAAR
jgi:hypothetical protein